jgi:hypothetical protein
MHFGDEIVHASDLFGARFDDDIDAIADDV